MKKLYVHVGAHKSASTTLQRSIRFNKDFFLKEYGISFIGGADLVGSDFLEHFKSLSRGEFLEDCSGYENSLKRARESIESIVRKTPSDEVLLSWEGVLGHSALDIYGGIYTHANKVAESLSISTESFLTSVLLIVRKQDEFIESCYLQQIKEGRLIEFDEFLSDIKETSLSWVSVAEEFGNKFEKFSVIPFDLIKARGSKKFIELCLLMLTDREIFLDQIKIVDRANASYSEYGVRLVLDVLPKISESNRDAVSKIFFSEFNSDKVEKASLFSDFSRRMILKALKADNEVLMKKYFKTIHELSPEEEKMLGSWLG